MSTSETDDFELGPCPCGAGKLIQSITTQDNPWSSVDVRYSVNCPVCSHDWRIDGRSLVYLKSEAPYNAASREERAKRAALMLLCDPLVDSYFHSFSAKTKKAEHTELVRLGIYAGSYRNFLADRKGNKTLSAITYGLRNLNWLTDLATHAGIKADFERKLREFTDAERQSSEASTAIIRRPFPELKFG